MINFLIQYGGILSFREVLSYWEVAGVFDIILPFLLVFALIFAILERTHVLGHNRAVYAIVSLAIAFFAITNETITRFFAILFSNAALGFIVLLVFILFLAMFSRGEGLGGWTWVGSVGALLIFFWVVSRSINQSPLKYDVFDFFHQNPFVWSTIFWSLALLAVIVIIVIAGSGGPGETPADAFRRFFTGGGGGGGGHH